MILFGHQTGNPNSHHAVLAHFERGWLDAFVVPWFPERGALRVVGALPPTRAMARRLERRRFEPLAGARFIQGRWGEFRRLGLRALGLGDEGLSYEVNDWLMRTMARACGRPRVTAVHSPEDASLWQFEEARRRGQACIYDLPIGYYPAWEQTQARLVREYSDWLPAGGLPSSRWVRPEQKRREMELADLVLAPSSFVERTIREFHPDKRIARAPYGVDLDFWTPPPLRSQVFSISGHQPSPSRPLLFLYAGQIGIRKGIPVLLEAWRAAALPDAELELVGLWQLSEKSRHELPPGVVHRPPCSRMELRERYHGADVFVFPSFFEGFGLVLLEAMACGVPCIASDASAGPDVLDDSCGRLVKAGNLEMLVEALRWFSSHRDQLPSMRRAARKRAEQCTWENYRQAVAAAVSHYL